MRIAGQAGDEEAGRERKEQSIDQRQRHAPELAAGYATQQHRHAGQRQESQQPVEGIQRPRREFSQNYIVAPEIGEKKQAEGAIAFLLADTVSGQKDAGQ